MQKKWQLFEEECYNHLVKNYGSKAIFLSVENLIQLNQI